MSLVTVKNLTMAFGTLQILNDASFYLNEDDRIGLVGPNGEGKTTLLRILAGELSPISGQVLARSRLRIGYLKQEPPPDEGGTLRGSMLDVFAELRKIEKQLQDLEHEVAENSHGELLEKYGHLQHEFEDMGGYDYHRKIEEVLTGLAFDEDTWDIPIDQLSGGQRRRGRLGAVLLGQPELLLLDEPTNHLDFETIEWLENYLKSFSGAIVTVSHDRCFLDNITTTTWDLAGGRLDIYRGCYTRYLPKKRERMEHRLKEWESQQDYISRTRDFIDRNIAGQRTKEAKGRQKRLQRYIRDEGVEKPVVPGTIHLPLKSSRRSGENVLDIENLSAGYEKGQPVVEASQLQVMRGYRIAIVGGNGTGKTTLIRTILGQLQPLNGKITFGANVDPGYIPQTRGQLDYDLSAVESVISENGCSMQRARDALGALLITGDDGDRPIRTLSGGQRSRVVMANLAVMEGNLLVLDEPTNHLDIPSTEILQEAIQLFDGTLLFITHDRRLIQEVATHIWSVENGRIRPIAGGWDTYLSRRRESTADTGKAREDKSVDYRDSRKKANLVKKLQRRSHQLEEEIDRTEGKLAELDRFISEAGKAGDVQRVETLGNEYQQTDSHLRELMSEWEQVGKDLSEVL